jgi:hypothetical protein
MFPVKGAILVKFQFFLGITPIFTGGIVPSLAYGTLQSDKLYRRFLAGHNLLLPIIYKVLLK